MLVQRREVDQLVGQLVMVLQGMYQLDRVDPEREGLVQREPQELGVCHSQRMLIGRAVDEVVGQVGACL